MCVCEQERLHGALADTAVSCSGFGRCTAAGVLVCAALWLPGGGVCGQKVTSGGLCPTRTPSALKPDGLWGLIPGDTSEKTVC